MEELVGVQEGVAEVDEGCFLGLFGCEGLLVGEEASGVLDLLGLGSAAEGAMVGQGDAGGFVVGMCGFEELGEGAGAVENPRVIEE